ncbi:MAG: phasin family protein [Deltaproteobacteria bacterium]
MSIFKEAFYLGLGAMSLTRERAEKFYDEMIAKGETSREEAKQFIEDAIKKGEEERKEMRNMVRDEFNEMRNEFSFVRKSDYDALEARVKELEEKLAQK